MTVSQTLRPSPVFRAQGPEAVKIVYASIPPDSAIPDIERHGAADSGAARAASRARPVLAVQPGLTSPT
jgi:hypothetical protein